MAFSSEIIAKLGLDSSAFARSLSAIPVQVEKVGQQASRTLEKTFNAGSIFKGFLSGLGIGSALAVINKLSGAIKESLQFSDRLAEKWSDISGNAASAAESLARIGKSEEEVLARAEARLTRLKETRDALLDSTGQKSFFAGLVERGSAVDKLFGFSRDDDLARAEKIKQLNKEIGDTIVESATRENTIKKTTVAETDRAAKDEAAQQREREAAVHRLADFEKQARFDKLDDGQKLVSLEKDRRSVASQIFEYEKQQREGVVLTTTGIDELLGLKKQQKSIEEEILALTNKKAEVENVIGQTIKSNIAEWEQFKISVTNTGRTDAELTDRELKRKISEIQQQLFASSLGRIDRVGVGNELGVGALDSVNGINLARAQAELNLRGRVRRTAGAFGEDAAFAQNPGLTEQRFREIIQGIDTSSTGKLASAIDKLNQRLDQPLRTIDISSPSPFRA